MNTKKVLFGILILFVGIMVLLRNLGVFHYSFNSVIFSWQTLLIVIGLIQLFDKKTSSKNAGGILIVTGVIFLIPKIFHVSLGAILLPALLIIGGILFIVQASTRRNQKGNPLSGNGEYVDFSEMPYEESSVGSEERLKREYVFSGSKERWSYGDIKAVEVEATFSNVEIDMTDINLSPEVERVHIKVTSVFSGVTLYIPDTWNVVIQKTGIFGGFVDKRTPHALPIGGKLVVLELEAVFGGGEIKCYE